MWHKICWLIHVKICWLIHVFFVKYMSLKYFLHQFRYFLCTVEIHQQIFQSNSFNENDVMVLFNWGWSCLINKLSVIRSLNLFASEARISKWSKSIEQLHSSRWSDTADCLTHLRWFPFNLDIPMCSAAVVKKWYVLQ